MGRPGYTKFRTLPRGRLGQTFATTGGYSFREQESLHFQRALHLVVDGFGQGLIRIGVDLVRSCVDQRDRDPLLVEGTAHVGVQRHDTDAANSARAG